MKLKELFENESNIHMWHGSQRWENPPTIRATKKGNAECGTGIYLTNRYETAQKYGKGSGSILYVQLSPNIQWLKHFSMPYEQLKHAIQYDIPGIKRKKEILSDLEYSHQRLGDKPIPLNYLNNLAVNNDASYGQSGLAITYWLKEQGVQATLEPQGHGEDWIVVFDPSIIRSVRKLDKSDKYLRYQDFPTIKEQLGGL